MQKYIFMWGEDGEAGDPWIGPITPRTVFAVTRVSYATMLNSNLDLQTSKFYVKSKQKGIGALTQN